MPPFLEPSNLKYETYRDIEGTICDAIKRRGAGERKDKGEGGKG